MAGGVTGGVAATWVGIWTLRCELCANFDTRGRLMVPNHVPSYWGFVTVGGEALDALYRVWPRCQTRYAELGAAGPAGSHSLLLSTVY